MGILKYRGHSVKFNQDPTQEELDQTIAYLDSLPEKKETVSMSHGEAFEKSWLNPVLQFAGAFNEATGRKVSKTPEGLTLNEDMQLKAFKDASAAFSAHPVTSVAGGVASTLQMAAPLAIAGLPFEGAGLTGMAAQQLIPRALFGGQQYMQSKGSRKTELMEGDQTKRDNADTAATTGAMTDAILGTIMPAGLSGVTQKAIPKALTAIGTGGLMQGAAGAAGDYAQNIEASNFNNLKQVNPLSPERRIPDLVTGGLLAPVFGHTMGKRKLETEALEIINSLRSGKDENKLARGLTSILEQRYKTAQEQASKSTARIQDLENAITNIRAADPEVAANLHNVFTKQIDIEKIALTKAKAEIEKLSNDLGLDKTKVNEHIEIKDVENNKADPDATTIKNNRPYTVEEIPLQEEVLGKKVEEPSPDIEVLEKSLETLKKKLDSEFADNSPATKIAYDHVKRILDYEKERWKQQINRGIESETIAKEEYDNATVKPEEITATEAVEPKQGPVIKNASEEEAGIIMSMLRKLGLDKEDIVIDMMSGLTGNARGLSGFRDNDPAKAYAEVSPTMVDKRNLPDYLAREIYKNLTPDQVAKFEKAWVAGHEIGHILLNRLLSTGLWNSDVLKVIHDYQKWEKKHPDLAKKQGAVTAERQADAGRYAYFSEYFAQRVAENLANPNKPNSVFKEYISDMRKIWRELVGKFHLGSKANKGVEALIKNVINANRESLDKTGKTLFEIQSTKRSVEQVQNILYNLRPEKERGLAAQPDIATDLSRVQQELSTVKDIDPVGLKAVLLVSKNLFGYMQQKGFWFDNPAVKYAHDVIKNADHLKIRRVNDLLLGSADKLVANGKRLWTLQRVASEKSVKTLLNKATDIDVYEVMSVFEKGVGQNYVKTLHEYGKNLTPNQVELYKTLARMFSTLNQMGKLHGNTLGKKSILPTKEGWIPSIRQGRFTVNLHYGGGLVKTKGIDDVEISDVIYSQRFFSKKEAEDFVTWFKEQDNQYGIITKGVLDESAEPFNQTKAEFLDALNEMLENNPTTRDAQIALKELNEKFNQERGKIGGHHRLRLNVPGSKGTELWATRQESGNSWRDAIFDAVDEYTAAMFKDEVKTRIDSLYENPDLKKTHPNTVDVIARMRDYAINDLKKSNMLEAWDDAKFWIDDVVNRAKFANAKNKRYVKQHTVDSTIGKMSRLFYIYALIGRPSFWAAQGSQFLWTGRSLVKEGSGPLRAMAEMGEGFKVAAEQPLEFKKALMWAIKNTHVFHPQFINDLNTFHWFGFKDDSAMKLIADLVVGEKQSSAADTFSRYMSFAMLYAHFSKKGLKGEELYKKVVEVTDENMVQYGRLYKAPIFQKLGPIGDLMSPLQTFSQAALGNFIADFRYWKKNPTDFNAAMPMVATMAISTLMAGAIGAPMIAEYEILARTINWLAKRLDSAFRMPLVSELVLSGDNDFSKRVLSHGLLSASTLAVSDEGFDIGSSLRWQPIFGGILQGEKSFMELLPALNWAVQMTKAGTTIARHAIGDSSITNAEVMTSAETLMPGWSKAIIPEKYSDKYGNPDIVLDTFGRAKRERTTAERAAKFMGTKTITGSTEERRLRILKEKRKSDMEEKTMLIRNIVDGDPKSEEYINRLAKDYHMNVKEIKNAVKAEMYKRNVPEGIRQFVGQGGNPNKGNILKYEETFDREPLEE